jgi:hypothetical protein
MPSTAGTQQHQVANNRRNTNNIRGADNSRNARNFGNTSSRGDLNSSNDGSYIYETLAIAKTPRTKQQW